MKTVEKMAWYAKQPWLQKVRVGDVLRSGRSLRVVRSVNRSKDGIVGGISFSIRNRSWTNRCYTCLNANDLRQRKFKPVGVRVRFTSKRDREIQRCIVRHCQRLTPKDVRGFL